jgi:predicted neuraminidase
MQANAATSGSQVNAAAFAAQPLGSASGAPVYTDLPAPCVQAHAANLAFLGDGSLGCVWFGGSMEGRADICIWFSRRAPRTGVWSAPQQLSNDPERSEQNPILFNAPSGALWLLHTAQFSGHQNTAIVRRRISTDHGHSWGPVQTLLGEPGVFVRQPPVQANDGSLLLPAYYCRSPPGQVWDGSLDESVVMRSTDGGSTWQAVCLPDSTGCVHMSIVTGAGAAARGNTSPGHLLALFRSRWADHIHLSRSADNGESWSPPQPTLLPNNNSSIQALRLADGRLAVIFNASSARDATERREGLYDEIEDSAPSAATVPPGAAAVLRDAAARAGAGAAMRALPRAAVPARPAIEASTRRSFWGVPRAPLTVAMSADDGLTWPWQKNIEVGDGYCMSNNSAQRLNREYSYPSLVQAADGALHAAYTVFRQHIRHVRLTPEWLMSAEA